MAKNLAARLHKQEEQEAASATPADVQPDTPPRRAGGSRQDRRGMVNIAAWFPVRVKFELEEIRLERSRKLGRKVTSQEILAEAYNDLFKKYGRAELAPMSGG
jgi:hypothetical protein